MLNIDLAYDHIQLFDIYAKKWKHVHTNFEH